MTEKEKLKELSKINHDDHCWITIDGGVKPSHTINICSCSSKKIFQKKWRKLKLYSTKPTER